MESVHDDVDLFTLRTLVIIFLFLESVARHLLLVCLAVQPLLLCILILLFFSPSDPLSLAVQSLSTPSCLSLHFINVVSAGLDLFFGEHFG